MSHIPLATPGSGADRVSRDLAARTAASQADRRHVRQCAMRKRSRRIRACRSALARANEIRIGGRDYSFRAGDDPAGKHRFKAAYSAGIQIAILPFGRWSFSRQGARLDAPAAGLSFAVAARNRGWRLTAVPPGYRNRITVDLDASDALTAYRHDTGPHRLALGFDAPVPLVPDAPPTARRFAIRMDPDEPVASGEVVSERAEGGRRLTWRFSSPRWAAGYPFQSVIQPNGGGHALTVRSLRP